MRDSFIKSLLFHAENNPNIWLMTADLGYSVVEEFEKKFPNRFINVGVAEQNMISMAAGIASLGATVFVYSIINFLILRALEQIRLDVCYHRLDVKLIGIGAGYTYESMGYSHHALEDLCALQSMPHLKIFSPADPVETTFSMDCLLKEKGPGYLRLDKGKSPILHHKPLELIHSPCIIQEGVDIAFFSTGSSLKEVLKAKTLLEQQGLSISIVSCPILKPIHVEKFIEIISKVKLVISVEPHGKGGLSSILSEIICQSSTKPHFHPIRYPEQPLSICGTDDELKRFAKVDAKSIAEIVFKLYDQLLTHSP